MLATGYVIPLGEVYKAFRMNLIPEKKLVSRNGRSYVTTVWVNPKSDKKLQQGSLFELEELDNPGLYKQKPQPRIGYLVKQRSRNLFEVRPLPGRLFSYNEKNALKEWLSSLGWEVVEDRTHLRAINPKEDGSMKIPDPLPSERQEAKMKKEAEKEERLERYRREREEYINTSDTAKWIRDVFGGEDIVNKFNVYELGLFLDGKKRKFEGMMNWRWEEGLKKLGVEYKGKTYQGIAEQIKEKYREWLDKNKEEENIRKKMEKYLQTSEAVKWIKSVFGEDVFDLTNLVALSLYLEGKRDKFEGRFNPKAKEGINKLGLSVDEYTTMTELLSRIKERYDKRLKPLEWYESLRKKGKRL